MRLLLVTIFAAVVCAAQHRAQLSGVVRDPSGAVVPGTAVHVLNTDTGVRRNAISNDEGVYAVSSLPSGRYKITARKHGFHTAARVGIQLEPMESVRADFRLKLGSVEETVTVEGAPSPINSADGAAGLTVQRERTEGLPLNGRGVLGLAELTAGVLATPATQGEAGQFTANGQRPNTNYFIVDGVGGNNGLTGSGSPGQFSGGTLPALTAIGSLHAIAPMADVQEVRVQTSTFAPEFGRLPGAQVAVTTRSGSNAIHGELSYAFRHERLAANDWFANRGGLKRVPLRLHDLAAGVGGPLRRDSTFFYASSEFLRLRQPATWIAAVPSARLRAAAGRDVLSLLDLFPLPNGPEIDSRTSEYTSQTSHPARVAASTLRLDHTLGTRGTAFLRYSHAPSRSESGYLQTDRARSLTRGLTLGVTNLIAPQVTSDARVNVSTNRAETRWTGGAEAPDQVSTLGPGYSRFFAIGIPGLGQIIRGDGGRSSQSQWNLMETLTWYRRSHQLRGGIDYQRLTPKRQEAIFSSAVVYRSFTDLLGGAPPATIFVDALAGSSVVETFSLFLQDTWQATSRTNITYGLRWEFTPPPSFRSSALTTVSVTTPLPGSPPPDRESAPPLGAATGTPLWNSSWRQLAPRVGIAHRLDESGQLVVRAGAGIFYDLGFSSASDLINGFPHNRWRSSQTIGLAYVDTLQYSFSPDLRIPRSYHWNLTLEREFAGRNIVSAGYVGSAARRLLRREAAYSPLASTAGVVVATSNGSSNYHSFQVQYRRSVARSVRSIASYTWGHAIDTGSWDSETYAAFAGRDRGSANFDVRHAFNAALAWDLPSRLRRWTLSGILRARTGFPIDVTVNENLFGIGYDNLRPDLAADVPVWIDGRLNRSAFVAPVGRQGTLGRNAIRGGGHAQVDASLERRFLVFGESALSFRAEVYNIANTPAFADPVRQLSHPLFGQRISQLNLMLGSGRPGSGLAPAFQTGGPRTLQLRIDLRF